MSAPGNVLYSCSPSAMAGSTGDSSGMIPLIQKSDLTISAMYGNSLHSLSSLAAAANGAGMGTPSNVHLLGHHHSFPHHLHHHQLGATEESETEQQQHDVKLSSNGSHHDELGGESGTQRNSSEATGGSSQTGGSTDNIGVWRPY